VTSDGVLFIFPVSILALIGAVLFRKTTTQTIPNHNEIRRFYDGVYYQNLHLTRNVSKHLHRLAVTLAPWEGKQLLDVGCGAGQWLIAAANLGAIPAGIDISQVAIDACRKILPQSELYCRPAEDLPFEDCRFDVISCLGSLEHFLEPEKALREMVRVAKPSARLLILVPNAGFLTRRLGLYSGTQQKEIREDVRTLAAWECLFESAGLRVVARWKDLHVISTSWIFRGRWFTWPFRTAQALALSLWPLSWQYQVFHLCKIR
jgi:SAM-dependent methyltransferase